MTVQMQKTAPLVRRILLVELVDQSGANSDQFITLVKRLGGVGRIGQEGKVEMGVAVAQVTDFQGVNIAPDLRFAQQQARNRDERRALAGNSLGIIQLGNSPGRHHDTGKVIHDTDGGMAGRDQQKQTGQQRNDDAEMLQEEEHQCEG